ncbi:phage GP46 family protein [Magnetospirillum molischianum]|uniref:GP46 family protein n=1 Tax=Magnetospirillum molischianum DSM 120 TaxID=1150626 RepID=H8FV04_MAGML|nr:phage GP46 family protein [Magnetospirillum molischianum]CCG42192.1 GP46 family protein [Magnetospirillum molischianum DSM 120]
MLVYAQDLSILIDGIETPLIVAIEDRLIRAVVSSLFSWRRAAPDDVLPDGATRMGWWADTYAAGSDQWGSRLWQLAREPLIPSVIRRARDYAIEALAWMVDDDVAARLDVDASRSGLSTLVLDVVIIRKDGSQLALSFASAWGTDHG